MALSSERRDIRFKSIQRRLQVQYFGEETEDTVKAESIIPGVRKTEAGHFQPFIMEADQNGRLREILALQAVRTQYEARAIAEKMARDEETRLKIRRNFGKP